jgi:DNA repair protein RecN (Recombination protein N)
MITQLRVKNFAIIDEQVVTFLPGLNVISGETGAGKSIILEALRLILGGRASTDLIRAGSADLAVEALFDLSVLPKHIRDELPEIVRPAAEDVEVSELVISRQLTRSGKGKVLINGQLGTVALLESITSKIITICSQNQQLALLDPKYHLAVIDSFAEGYNGLLEKFRTAFREYRTKKEALLALEAKMSQGVLRRAELEHLLEELEPLDLHAQLRTELEERIARLAHAEKALIQGERAEEIISGEAGLLSLLAELRSELNAIARGDPQASRLMANFEKLKALTDEFEADLAQYLRGVELEPAELEELRGRLSNLAKLERRFRTNDAGLLELLTSARAELSAFDAFENVEGLRKEVKQLEAAAQALGVELRAKRTKEAKRLAAAVAGELAELNMPDAIIAPQFEAIELSEEGIDRMQLLIATNKGEPLKPLKQVASGGELSRLMLVLKKVLRDRSGVNVLIFDEVDSGISGGVARAVGEKLKSLSESSQVICITHLAQVASLADSHILVEKRSKDRTTSLVRVLDKEERVEEIARMLAGYKVTAASRESARELMTSKGSR